MRTASFLLLTFLLFPAADTRSQQLYEKSGDGITLHAGTSWIRLRVCNARTIRVMVSAIPTFGFRPSLVVTRAWPKAPWQSTLHGTVLTLSTAQVRAEVNTRTGAIEFSDASGNPLLREDPIEPHILKPVVVTGENVFEVTQRFRLSDDEGIYGLGQFEDGIMNLRNHDIILVQNNRHICVPFIHSSRSYGIYWDNYSDTRFHDGPDGMMLRSEVADGIDYYFISGSTPDGVIAGYREATGQVPMFPRWAFGYWQSKERYENQSELLSVAREYRRRGLPVDNIVQDWQYWGRLGWNAMAFDDSTYPDPRGMIDSLHNQYHMQIMLSIWPQVGPTTAVYRELKAAGHLYPTTIWNGGKTYDAYSKEARAIYWRHLSKGLYSLGIDAWWVDATEPDSAWCDTPLEEKIGIVSNGMTALGPSTRYLNTFSLMTTAGIYEHQRRENPSRRIVMLTRSAFAGQQRNSMAVWSGDISSTWGVFRNQISGGMNFSMAGLPWWNSDIGGFLPKEYGGEYPLGNRDPSFQELYVRWFQFGAFSPIFRAHGTDFAREIWQFGEPGHWAYDALVKYDQLRYRLLPYIYSAAWMVTNQQSTLMRGLPMDFGHDPNVMNVNDEYMFGPCLLVAPVTHAMYYPKNPAVVVPSGNLRTASQEPGLLGYYFRGTAFDTLDHTQRDTSVHFAWAGGAPGVGMTNFTVRWEGKVFAPEDGMYQFEVTSNDGVNLWINGRQIMDEMYPAGRQMNVGEIMLKAGSWNDIRFEYQQLDKAAEVSLAWRTPPMLASYRPSLEPGSDTVYLPQSAGWVDFWTGEYSTGGRQVGKLAPVDLLPLYVRAGSVLPMGPLVQYATEKPADPLEVRVYPGANGTFTLFEDENEGYRYEKGVFATITFTWDDATQSLTIGDRNGSFPGMLKSRTFNIVKVRPGKGTGDGQASSPDRLVAYRGRKLRVKLP